MTADTAEREAFEKFCRENAAMVDLRRNAVEPNFYESFATQDAWRIWQARAALPARAPEGWADLLGHARAVIASLSGGPDGSCAETIKKIDAMLSASPPPPEQQMVSAEQRYRQRYRQRTEELEIMTHAILDLYGTSGLAKVTTRALEIRETAPPSPDPITSPARYDFQTPKIGSEGQPYREPPPDPIASPAPGPAGEGGGA